MILIVCLVLMLAACTTTTPEESASETASVSEAASAESEAPSEEAEATESDLPVVGIANGYYGNSFRDEMLASIEEVGDEYKEAGIIADYKIVNNVTQGDVTEQANIIRDFIQEGVDIIMVNPNAPDALNGVLAEAQDAGILCVAFDASVTAPDVLNVTIDHYAWSEKNVEWIASTLQEGNVIEIFGMDGHPANNERIKATADVLANYPDINLIASVTGSWDETKAKEAATQLIASGQEIDGVITQDTMATGCLTAFMDAGKLPKVMYGDPGTAFFKLWKDLRDENADIKICTQANPPGIGGTAFRLAVKLYDGQEFKEGALTDGVYYYPVKQFFTDENFDEGWAILENEPDDYLLNEVLSEEDAQALFQ
jgi:ribose transport system substrate-binding protein